MNYISTFFDGIVHLMYPHTCAGCGDDILARHEVICVQCFNDLPFTNFHAHAENPVEKVFRGRIEISAATSLLYFTKGSIIQSLLHQLKYKGRKDVGSYLGRVMGDALTNSAHFSDVEVIVPLPLYRAKEKHRGYNQAEVIADGLAQSMNVPIENTAVRNVKKTGTQTRMSRMARWESSIGKFEVHNSKALAGKNVLLVDDVITTGATLEACGNAMLKIPGIHLSVASLAYTII